VCCLFMILAVIGPRAAAVVWWLAEPSRWSFTFDTWIMPVLGIIFLPWLTLAYVLVAPGGVGGFDWVVLLLAFVVDIAMYSGSAAKSRQTMGMTGD
jgi:hypothetical protein